MSLLRKIYRIPLVLLWFVLCAVYVHLVNHGARAAQRSLDLTLMWARVSAWIIGLKIKIEGDIGDFRGGLIAANHQSVLDTLVLGASFRIRFAPKVEMRKWPLIGWLIQCNKPVWIDRTTPRKAKASADAMSRTMQDGLAMMVFPEGTTSDGKEGLLPFKSTAFQAAIDAERSVLPVIISYAPEIRSEVQWCGDRSFLQHIWRVLGLKEARATVYIMKSISVAGSKDRKELAAAVYSIMNEKWRNL